LKSGIAYLGEKRVAVIQALADHPAFREYELLRLPPDEEYAANCVRVNEYVLMAAGYPHFQKMLDEAGYQLIVLEMSEYQKMDGGLSCLSLRY
jgi:dimethylargininase